VFSIWLIIVKAIALADGLLSYFVYANVEFTHADDGQWEQVFMNASLTTKGSAVLADVATIIHNLMDFLAQFMTILPAQSGVVYNGLTTFTPP
jgi:hypothetical protein